MILLYKAKLRTTDLVIQHVGGREVVGREDNENFFDTAFQLLEQYYL